MSKVLWWKRSLRGNYISFGYCRRRTLLSAGTAFKDFLSYSLYSLPYRSTVWATPIITIEFTNGILVRNGTTTLLWIEGEYR